MKQRHWIVRLIALCIAVSMAIGATPVAEATNEEKQMEELIAAQERAVAANEALMQYFFRNGWIEEYPPYFTGCYIEDNMLHICLVNSAAGAKEVLANILSAYSDVIVYEYSDYSRADLQAYADELAEELKEQGCGVTYWYVDDMNGSVVIGVLSEDVAEATEEIKAVQLYSLGRLPEVVIEPGAYVCTELDLLGGSQITIEDAGYASIGACGEYNQYTTFDAFITCGHDVPSSSMVYIGRNLIGTVFEVQFTDGERGDYSVILAADNTEHTHKIGNEARGITTITGGTNLSPAVGSYIKKYGYKSGYSYGRIVSTNASCEYESGEVILGLTKVLLTSGTSQTGDSGGPYLVNNAFCGVHCGRDKHDNAYVYFTPYSIINAGGFTAIGNHDCRLWVDDGSTNHSGYCFICKTIVYEAHYEYWDGTVGRCTRCGRTDPILIEAS